MSEEEPSAKKSPKGGEEAGEREKNSEPMAKETRVFKKTDIPPDVVVDKYTPEAIRQEVIKQAKLIRDWAKEMGFEEGKDYRIIENIRNAIGADASVAPHELKQFFVIIHESKYRQFQDYFKGRYWDEMKKKNPENDAKLLYSWGGRFLVGWAGVPFDTGRALSIKEMTGLTRHAKFKQFFRDRTGFDLPTAEKLNPMLKEIAEKGLPLYEAALTKLEEMKSAATLSNDGYRVIDGVVHAVELLRTALTGQAVEELPEILTERMTREVRTYADLTYNAGTIVDLDKVEEITGIVIPKDLRIDRIFENNFGFNRDQMEGICEDFANLVDAEQELQKL